MRIEHIGVTQFRSYPELELSFPEGITLLYGNNGSGKTNILEAIYLTSVGKSPRTNRDTHMIRLGEDSASVRVRFVRRSVSQQVQVILHQRQKKELQINSTPVRQKEIVGTLQTVFFGPDDLQLIKGSPGIRRRFLDLTLARANPLYYDALLKYNRILQQRNYVLKEKTGNLVGWDEQLATQAVYLTQQRLAAIEMWNEHAAIVAGELTHDQLHLQIAYYRPYGKDREITIESYLQLLTESEESDRRYGYTSVGPHRGDIHIYNDQCNLADYGSQGEQRAAVLALKLSEIRFLREQTGDAPILLLDDVLSELDPSRQQALIEWTQRHDVQMIMTAAFLPNRDQTHFHVIHVTEEGIHEI